MPGDDVDAVAAPVAGHARHVAPGLDDRVADRHAEIARGAHAVVAPRDDAAGHRVLGEVRVGPLVDVVGVAVPPLLQELRPGPGVVDLVEVHLVRLGQPEHAQPEDRHDEHDEDPEVEAVEAAAGLVVEGLRAVGPERPGSDLLAQPLDDAHLGSGRRFGPGRERRLRRPGSRSRLPGAGRDCAGRRRVDRRRPRSMRRRWPRPVTRPRPRPQGHPARRPRTSRPS